MNPNTKKILIGIADRHKIYRRNLKEIIEFLGEEYKVIQTSDYLSDLLSSETLPRSLSILIANLDGEYTKALRTLSQLKAMAPSTRIIIITSYEEELPKRQLNELGVHGCLSRNSDPNELKRAIDTVYNNGFYPQAQFL